MAEFSVPLPLKLIRLLSLALVELGMLDLTLLLLLKLPRRMYPWSRLEIKVGFFYTFLLSANAEGVC